MPLKHGFDYVADWRCAPMAYWVHVEQDGKHWQQADAFDPPAPRRIPGKGHRVLWIEVRDETLVFSSPAQLREFVAILSMKPLPSTRRLSMLRATGHGPNSHWLSRLPAWIKARPFRERTLPRIARLADELASGADWP